MLIFIDESGDAGFKTSKGSSSHFVIALVIFDEELAAEETAVAIKRFRKNLGKSEAFEFKFNKCEKKLRIQFLEEVKSLPFRYRAIVFDKRILYSQFLRNKKESFYSFALRMVLEHNSKTIHDAKIRLDGSGERAFRVQLTTYLRKSLNSESLKIMNNLRFRDSKSDVLIQLADIIAGSIRRSYDTSDASNSIYRKLLKKREDDVWEFK